MALPIVARPEECDRTRAAALDAGQTSTHVSARVRSGRPHRARECPVARAERPAATGGRQSSGNFEDLRVLTTSEVVNILPLETWVSSEGEASRCCTPRMGDAADPRPEKEWHTRAEEARERAEQARVRLAELRRRGVSTPSEVNEAAERAAQARLHAARGYVRAALAHEQAAQLLDALAADGGPNAAARRAAAERHRSAALDDRQAATPQEQARGETPTSHSD